MAVTPFPHVVASPLLPWNATGVTPAANLAALQCGRTARRHDRGGHVPRGGRSRTPAESSWDRSIVSGERFTRGWRDGAYWAAWSSGGPNTERQEPSTDSARGPRGPRGGVPGRDRTRGRNPGGPRNEARPASDP